METGEDIICTIQRYCVGQSVMDGDHGERDPRHGGLRPTLLPSSQSQRGNHAETMEDFDQPFYQVLKVKEVTIQKLQRTSINPSIKFSKSKR